MPTAPETHYARSGDIDLAYQVIGDGPFDFVFVPGWVWNLELCWELAEIARFFERLSSFARLILFDKRGVGLSDRPGGVVTLQERADDILAVLDAVGSQRAAVGGWFDGGAMAAHFAATHPERVAALIIGSFVARPAGGEGVPVGLDPEALADFAVVIEHRWGTAGMLRRVAPSVVDDERFVSFWRRFERASASPHAAAAQLRWNQAIDLVDVLPLVSAPTLVLHRAGSTTVPAAGVRDLAARIPGARYVEVPGADVYPFVGDSDSVIEEIESFLTGVRPPAPSTRTLATVLFTDIVGSTERASTLGDQAWGDVLDAHHREIRAVIDRFDGREIDTAGDGFLVTFDGPERAVRAAIAAVDAVQAVGVHIRAGLHTGEVVSSGGDVAGLAVHIGARVGALAAADEVLVTRTVKDLALGSTLVFEDAGEHELKGVPDHWQLYRVVR
ncbi:MAG: adenylate/guanylate cyclase domain-containing protein [Acidimicrobiia bacterium]